LPAARKPFLARLADYAVQNGSARLTPAQARRLRKKDARRGNVGSAQA
jgi:hypothetical protein